MLGVTAVVAGLLSVPAGADDGRTVAPALPRPDGVLLEVGPDGPVSHRSPGDVLAATRRFGDDGTALRALAAAAAAAGQPASLVVPAEEVAESEEAVVTSFAAAVPGGDLDGDGLADVLTYADGPDGDLLLVARRGTDGAQLWSRPLEATTGTLAFPAGRDLTGDGVDDLLLDELSLALGSEEQETPTGSRYAASGTLSHGYGVVSGADGTTTWSRRLAGTLTEELTYDGDPLGLAGDAAYRLRSTNLAVLALLTDDADGDGLPDVVVNEVDLDVDERVTGAGGGLVAGLQREGLSVSSGTRAQLVSGVDGAASPLRTAAGQSGVSLLVPVGQVTGGPLADLAWSTDLLPVVDRTCVVTPAAGPCADRSTGSEQVAVELLTDGTDQVAWGSTVPGSGGFTVPVGADLDGAGTDELALSLFDADGGRLVVLAGEDGRPLWDVRSELFPPSLVGTAGPVAVVADVVSEGDGLVAVTTRRDGATGAVLGTDRHRAVAPEPEPGAAGAFTLLLVGVSALADGDGDGGAELGAFSLGLTVSFDDAFEVVGEAARSAADYRDLATGDLLLSEAADDPRLLVPAGGDLDGDGLADLHREVYGVTSADTGSTHGVRLADGRELWRVDGFAVTAGDQDGAAGQELLLVRLGVNGLETASLRGTDAQQRWTAPVQQGVPAR